MLETWLLKYQEIPRTIDFGFISGAHVGSTDAGSQVHIVATLLREAHLEPLVRAKINMVPLPLGTTSYAPAIKGGKDCETRSPVHEISECTRKGGLALIWLAPPCNPPLYHNYVCRRKFFGTKTSSKFVGWEVILRVKILRYCINPAHASLDTDSVRSRPQHLIGLTLPSLRLLNTFYDSP